jgi:acyl carrier protein
MKETEIIESLKRYIVYEILDGNDIGLDGSTPLLEWGIINSMEIAKLIIFVQDQLGVRIPNDKIAAEYFINLIALTNLILELTNGDKA